MVELITPWPAALRNTRPPKVGDKYWLDWKQEHGGTFVEPYEQDLTRNPYLPSTSRLLFAVPLDGLPKPPTGPYDDAPEMARDAVAALVDELNTVVDPVTAQIERS